MLYHISKREAKPSVVYLIKHELRVLLMTSKPIHFIPILPICKNFQYRCCISRENRGKRFVKIHMCFISYVDSSHGYDFLCVFLMNY